MKNTMVIGILGGMGPEATADLFQKIIKETCVTKDQDHYRVIIDSNPKIPDRTQAILYNGETPIPMMIQTAENLVKAGADIILIPCMTSGYFLPYIQKEISIPIVDSFAVLSIYLRTNYPEMKKLGVMATTGTKKSGLFTDKMSQYEVLYPTEISQETEVMKAIYGTNGIKLGNTGVYPRGLLKKASDSLVEQGAEAVVAGCTEISLAFKQEGLSYPLINPMQVLAEYVTSESVATSLDKQIKKTIF